MSCKTESVLTLKDIVVSYSGQTAQPVLDHLSLDIKRGEILGLVGESGSGKTTMARVITGLLAVDEGQVFFEGKQIKENRMKKRLQQTGLGIQMVFQNPYGSFDPKRTIGWQLEEALQLRGWKKGQDRTNRALSALHRVGLDDDYFDRLPHELSGGQLQRIALGMVLMLRPSLLIVDEPVSALDVSVQAQILNLMQVIHREAKFSCLFIAHDLKVVHYLCDRVAVLKDGQIVEVLPAENLWTQAKHSYTQQLIAAVGYPDGQYGKPDNGLSVE